MTYSDNENTESGSAEALDPRVNAELMRLFRLRDRVYSTMVDWEAGLLTRSEAWSKLVELLNDEPYLSLGLLSEESTERTQDTTSTAERESLPVRTVAPPMLPPVENGSEDGEEDSRTEDWTNRDEHTYREKGGRVPMYYQSPGNHLSKYQCLRCLFGQVHPWHDNGEWNKEYGIAPSNRHH